jgi:hypothetical protein
MLNIYHETLGECVSEVNNRLAKKDVVIADPAWADSLPAVNYEQALNLDLQIVTLRGKFTKKYFHVNIYRLPSGRYELNTYIL